MANPLSDRGWSDRDYAAAIGTLAGEAATKGSLRDYQAIADVIANRLDDRNFASQYGRNVASQALNPKEFSTWDKAQKEAYRNAVTSFNAALNPKLEAKLPAALQERVSLAKQAVEDVFSTGKARGIAMGSTFYDNPKVTTALGTGGFHNGLENQYGSVTIGDHRFTGPGFNPDMEFDPVSLHGQLQDVGLPAELSGLTPPAVNIGTPDLPGPLGGFGNIDGLSIGAPSTPDVMSQFAGPSYSDITNGTAFDPIGGLNVSVPSTPDVMGQFEGPTYPDMSAGLYGGPPASDVSVPSPPDVGGLSGLDAYGPAMSEAGWASPSHMGFDAGSFQTPDFDAPTQQARDRIANFESRNFVGLGAPDFEGMARDLTTEITGKTAFDTVSTPEHYTVMENRTREVPFSAPNALQDAVMGDWEDKLGPAKPAMASKPQTRIETYQVPVEKTRMVQQQVPKALPSLPEVEVPAAPSLSSSFASAPPGLGDQFGMGLHGFEGFLGAMNARDPAAMNAINDAGMGYAANYAMGDGPYADDGHQRPARQVRLAVRDGCPQGCGRRLQAGLRATVSDRTGRDRGGHEGPCDGWTSGNARGWRVGGSRRLCHAQWVPRDLGLHVRRRLGQ
jgi:hypothetical protein